MIETEREILGCFFADPSLIMRDIEKYFQTEGLKDIYGAMIDLLEAGEPINVVTVAEIISPNMKGAATTISELVSYPAHTRQKFLDREVSDCLFRMKTSYYRNQVMTKCRDPLYQLEDISADLAKVSVNREFHVGKSVGDGLLALADDLNREDNVKCGFGAIDEKVGGFRRGELISFMARPTIGKTFTLLNVVHYLRNTDHRMGFFSLEMPLSALTERLLQIHDGLRWRTITAEYLALNNHDQFRDAYKNLTIHARIYSVGQMARLIEDERDDVVFIDFLGLIKASREFKSAYEQVSKTFIELKTMAKEKNVVLFLAVQLSRLGGDGTVPVKMGSARDSGQIEELSDFIIGCWRPGLYSDSSEKKAKLVLSLEKNKRGDVVTRIFKLLPTGEIVGTTDGLNQEEKPTQGGTNGKESGSEGQG